MPPLLADTLLNDLARWFVDQAWLVFGLAIFVMICALLLRDWWRQRPAAVRSSTCFSCDRAAPPVPRSGNRYFCAACRREFTGPPHG